MREKLEGVGIGCGEFVQCNEELKGLAEDPKVELIHVGFSDGSVEWWLY
jgi:hypothetical protein